MQIHQAHTHTDTQAVSYAALTTTHVVRLSDRILDPLPAVWMRHIVYICTHVVSAARIIKLVKETHTHMRISDAHGSTHALA